MDRIEKILVFVVVATIVVIVTLALSNSGDEIGSKVPALADRREAADLPLAEEDGVGNDSLEIAKREPEPASPTPAPDPGPTPDPAPEAKKPELPVTPPAGPVEPEKPAAAPKPAWDSKYVVQKNDSFWSIAEAKYGNGKYWTMIRDHNKDVDSDNLQPGTVLVLPPLDNVVKAVRTPALEVGGNYRTVTLKKGEYIYAVLRREGLTDRCDEILRLNHLNRETAENVQPGFVLKLPRK